MAATATGAWCNTPGMMKAVRRSGLTTIGADEQEVMRVTYRDALEAVRSLYIDELKPFGRVILKRLRENAAAAQCLAMGLPVESADPDAAPRVDPRRLRRMCENCNHFRVLREEGREYSVLLTHDAGSFVDVCSPNDVYPQEMWHAAAAYFEAQALSVEGLQLPGGRYACARALHLKRLAFLHGRSLGEVCHIVQLAISQKRLLGYRDGMLVPFSMSEECVKERCALAQQPIACSSLPLATIEDARHGLWQLLSSRPESGGLTLSNVKRFFRSRFSMELSETALGHCRLHSLLSDPRLQDICRVETLPSGQVVVLAACAAPLQQPRCCNLAPAYAPPPLQRSAPSPCAPPSMDVDTAFASALFGATQGTSPSAMSMQSTTCSSPPRRRQSGYAGHTVPGVAETFPRPKGVSSCTQSTTDSYEDYVDLTGSFSISGEDANDGVLGGGAPENESTNPNMFYVKNTFIHFGDRVDEGTTEGAAGSSSRRTASVPRSFGMASPADGTPPSPSTPSSTRRRRTGTSMRL